MKLLAFIALAALTASAGEIPRGSDGRPDFSGIWQSLSGADYGLEPHLATKTDPPGLGVVEGGVIPYQPWALEQRAKNYAARATADPRTQCFTLGTPRGLYANSPFQIFQRPRDLTVLFEFGHPVRTINTNGTDHPEGHIDFWLGDSRGHWEGDTLVVDVTNYSGQGMIATSAATGRIRGVPESADLHVVERFTRTGPETIKYEVTIEDPKAYTKPWKVSIPLEKQSDYTLYEYACHEGNIALGDILRGGRLADGRP